MLPKSLLILVTSLAIATASTPRGVFPGDAMLYAPSSADTFACLAHPSVQIPFSRVNDDFCDCPDGSDEPGTAACANIPPKSLAIPGFYCLNPGHTPAFLPLSRVNDGACDYDICCDGSDEYAGVGGVKCPSKCKEIGSEARKMAAERLARRIKGTKARDALVKKAASLRKEIEDNIASVKIKIQANELNVKNAEQALKETEERERQKTLRNPTPQSKLSVVVEAARQRMEELKGHMARLQEQRDQAEERLEKTEAILSVLKTDHNPNFNDKGVKRAISAWEEYQADPLTSTNRNKAEDRDIQESIDSNEVGWDELAGPPEEELPDFYRLTQYLPPGARTWINDRICGFRGFLVAQGVLAPKPAGSESPAVAAARDHLATAETDLSNGRAKLQDLETDLSAAFGPSDVFRPLKGTCISREFGEYKYEYCFMEKAHQISRKDGSRTSLGNFKEIELADESSKNEANGVFASSWKESHEEPLSGMSLRHDSGQQCWNGPMRSVQVHLYCCAENEIRSVVEAEKCVYRFEVGTPAVCENGGEKKKKVKDEL